MRRRALFSLAIVSLLVLLLAPDAVGRERELAHDDGRQVGKKSAAGTGHVISFERPRGSWWIEAVRVYGSRYGGGYDPRETEFTVAVCDEGLYPLATTRASYDLFPYGEFAWVDVPLEAAVAAPAAFKVVVAFDPEATRGVYVGHGAAEESHSGWGLAGGEERPFDSGQEWMIRALLTSRRPRDAGESVDLYRDTGRRTGKRSIAGSGHVVEFEKPSGTWWIASVLVHGQRYGGGYDPNATSFDLAITDRSMKPLTAQRASYALFSGTFAWVEVRLEEPVKAPSRFRAAVAFDPARTRGVYVGYGEGDEEHSYTGLAGERAREFEDGAWMIRVRLVKEKPEPPRPEGPPAHDPRTYVRDFEFLERTVRDEFPALEKKGVDWRAVCREWRGRFEDCRDDETHVLNVHRLLAVLGDMHTGVTTSRVSPHVPLFDGLYGAGLWIAVDEGHLRLRALLPGHALEDRIGPGAELLEIGGRPARFVHDEVRGQLRAWTGWSSTHFLDARISFQFFPFGEARSLSARFLEPGGEVVDVDLPRWGPGGRGLSRAEVTMPEGLEARGRAVSTRLGEDLGYVRILGSMDEATQEAFFAALDGLRGVEGILLDCRGMGGGGDHPAWAMAGRFFAERTAQGTSQPLVPTGAWQFEGPVVMLQDEREVSSAETFTWAMTETGRAVAVGRPTGGATIIPRTFEAPSGLFSFRLGVHDRRTPIRGIQPEGTGTRPDVFVPYDPALLARHADPVREAGRQILRLLVDGASREAVLDLYAGVLGLEPDRLRALEDGGRGLEPPEGPDLLGRSEGTLAERVAWEVDVAGRAEHHAPDFVAAAARLARFAEVAEVLGDDALAARARRAAGAWADEVEAQRAWEALCAAGPSPDEVARRRYLAEHGETRYGAAVRRDAER